MRNNNIAYLDGLHLEKARGASRGEIWIFVVAVCAVTLILATGVAIAHKKKRRKNSVRSDRTNMAFREDQTPRRDVFSIFVVRELTSRTVDFFCLSCQVKTEATSTEGMASAARTPEPKPRNRNKISNSLLSMKAANKFQKLVLYRYSRYGEYERYFKWSLRK